MCVCMYVGMYVCVCVSLRFDDAVYSPQGYVCMYVGLYVCVFVCVIEV